MVFPLACQVGEGEWYRFDKRVHSFIFKEAVLESPAVFARLQKRRSSLVKPTRIFSRGCAPLASHRRLRPSALRAPRAS